MEKPQTLINLSAVRGNLRKQPNYVASANFPAASGWELAKTGLRLVQKSNSCEQVGIGVGKVLDHKLFCGPVGSYNPEFKATSPLEKAKYTFTIGQPIEPGFCEDYEQMFLNLDKIQNSISYGKDRRNMLDPVTKTI